MQLRAFLLQGLRELPVIGTRHPRRPGSRLVKSTARRRALPFHRQNGLPHPQRNRILRLHGRIHPLPVNHRPARTFQILRLKKIRSQDEAHMARTHFGSSQDDGAFRVRTNNPLPWPQPPHTPIAIGCEVGDGKLGIHPETKIDLGEQTLCENAWRFCGLFAAPKRNHSREETFGVILLSPAPTPP